MVYSPTKKPTHKASLANAVATVARRQSLSRSRKKAVARSESSTIDLGCTKVIGRKQIPLKSTPIQSTSKSDNFKFENVDYEFSTLTF